MDRYRGRNLRILLADRIPLLFRTREINIFQNTVFTEYIASNARNSIENNNTRQLVTSNKHTVRHRRH